MTENDHWRGDTESPTEACTCSSRLKLPAVSKRSSRIVLGRAFVVLPPPRETDTHDMRPDQRSSVASNGLFLVQVFVAWHDKSSGCESWTVSFAFFVLFISIFFSSK